MLKFRKKQSPESIAKRVRQGRGTEPADLVIRNVQLLSMITGAITPGDIAICGDMIVGTHGDYQGKREIDGGGRFVVPGFIDTHLHIESSLTTPGEFERCVLPHGTTTAICDPHEIANVAGEEGIAYFRRAAEQAVMSLFVQLSSCVPATGMETAGAALSAADLAALSEHPHVIGLAEFMNFPGVLFEDPEVLQKLSDFSHGHIDGHCPLLGGLDLNGYLAAGIMTDHESSNLEEAREKLEKGMRILIREGSVSKDLDALIPLISGDTSAFLAFCTDDRNPLDIAEEGHIDCMIRRAIAAGAPLHHVYRIASCSGAQIFGLRDRGLIAPGYRADFVLLDALETCAIHDVVVGGLPAAEALAKQKTPVPAPARQSVHLPQLELSHFDNFGPSTTPVIGVDPGKIITQHLTFELDVSARGRQIDVSRDLLKVAVIERHGKNGSVGLGFVHGFSLQSGAIASSVGHDSHNVCVIGASEEDMLAAVQRIGELQGGFVVANEGEVTGEFALPIAGLISDLSFEEITEKLIPLRKAAQAIGCTLPEPFLQVGFLPLPVIPHLKLTDQGLVDVDRFAIIEHARNFAR